MEKQEKKYPEPVVGALIINKEGKILLGKSVKWGGKYTCFGGHVESGETLEEATKREVKEEVGIEVEIKTPLGFSDSVYDPDFHEKKHFVFIDYLCEFSGKDEEVKLNDEYENDFIWTFPEEALKLDLPQGTRDIIEEYLNLKEKEKGFENWKRAVADFENYKKRQQENAKNMIAFSNKNMIMQILPILDNFHVSTDHIPQDQKENSWVTGIMHIQKQLEKVLEDNGVSEIKIKPGDKFDPEVMEAVKQESENSEQGTEKGKNIIKKILVRGYKIDNKIIRAAKVIVA